MPHCTIVLITLRLHTCLQSKHRCRSRETLTHSGRVMHICVSKLTIIGSDNGLSPGRCQAIIWTSAGILLIRTIGTNFGEILGKIHLFSFSEMHLKMSSAKCRLFGLGLNELRDMHEGSLKIDIFCMEVPIRIARPVHHMTKRYHISYHEWWSQSILGWKKFTTDFSGLFNMLWINT